MAWDICCYYKRKKRKTKEEILDFPRPRARLQFSWLGKQHYQKKPVSMVLSMTPGCVGIPFWGSNETHELLSIAQGKHLTAHLVLGPLCIVLCFVCLLSRALARSYTICVVLGLLRAKTEITVTRRFLSWAKEAKEWRSRCNCQWALLANVSLSSLLHCPLSMSSTISEALAATCSHMAELGQGSHPPQHATFAGSVYSLSPMPKSTTFAASAACIALILPRPLDSVFRYR